MSEMGLKIRRVLIDSLHADPANVRLHDRQNLDAIAASLKTFGQVEPLVVQKGTKAGFRKKSRNRQLTYFPLSVVGRAVGMRECGESQP